MDTSVADRYLARIGAAAAEVNAEGLARLQEQHLHTVPFENLDIHLGVPITLDDEHLIDKIVDRRRGGFCYEMNGLFAALLAQLGFPVTPLAARVYGANGLGPPFDHLALRVDLDEPWLADVGFGRFSARPLRLDLRDDQPDPAGTFRIVDTDHGDLDVLMDGRPQYRLELRPRELRDFEAMCEWQQTSPRSAFIQGPVASLLTEGGRVTLSGNLLIETVNGTREERTIEDADLLATYHQRFGITLDRLPTRPGAAAARA